MTQVGEFNAWRLEYPGMSEADHAAFYEQVARDHPDQSHFSLQHALEFFDLARARRVLEIGGWDGEMAQMILRGPEPIKVWHNYEIASVPQVCDDERYRAVHGIFPWTESIDDYDTLIASHVLEHISVDHAEALFEATAGVTFLYTDIPICTKRGGKWKDEDAAHITTDEELIPIISSHGFVLMGEPIHRVTGSYVRMYER